MHRYRCLFVACVFTALTVEAPAAGTTRIVVAGDLVASSHATARPPRTGWGQLLDRYTEIPVLLMSAAERARASQAAAVLEPTASTLGPGDLLLIQLPAADTGADAAAADADIAALRQLLATARAQGVRALLLSAVARREFTSDGRAIESPGTDSSRLRTLAGQEGLVFIDLAAHSRAWLEALGPEASKAWFFHDPRTGYADLAELHERGAFAIACLVMTELVAARVLAPAQLTRALDCALTAGTADGSRTPILEHIDAIPQQAIERHGSSGLALAAPLFRSTPAAALQVQRLVLHAGAALGVHQHPFEETYYVISGRAEASVDGQAHQLVPGSVLLIPAAAAHSLRHTGTEDLVVLAMHPRAH